MVDQQQKQNQQTDIEQSVLSSPISLNSMVVPTITGSLSNTSGNNGGIGVTFGLGRGTNSQQQPNSMRTL